MRTTWVVAWILWILALACFAGAWLAYRADAPHQSVRLSYAGLTLLAAGLVAVSIVRAFPDLA